MPLRKRVTTASTSALRTARRALAECPAWKKLTRRLSATWLTSKRPSADRFNPPMRCEIIALLEADESRLGEVYRCVQRGMTPEAIAAELDVGSTGFVWSYNRIARALVEGNLPTAPTVALSAARRFRSILKTAALS